MTNYRQSTTEGEITTHRRLSHGTIFNEAIPRIELHDEDLTVLPDGKSISSYVGSLSYAMSDPTVEIPIIDPSTFEPTEETITAGEVWVALASVYLWLARQRDAA